MAGETANGAGFFAAGAPRTDSSTVVGATDSEMYEYLTSFPPPPRRRRRLLLLASTQVKLLCR